MSVGMATGSPRGNYSTLPNSQTGVSNSYQAGRAANPASPIVPSQSFQFPTASPRGAYPTITNGLTGVSNSYVNGRVRQPAPATTPTSTSGLTPVQGKALIDRMSAVRGASTSEQYGRSVWGIVPTPPDKPLTFGANTAGARTRSGIAQGGGIGGRYNSDVADQQRFLNRGGAGLVVDGIEGPLTKKAFEQYKDYAKATQYAQSMSKPMTPTGLDRVGSMQLKTGLSADLSDKVKPFSPVPTTPPTTDPASKPDLSRMGGDALDLVRAGIGASLAAKPIDMPTIPQRWMDYQNEITSRKNQGMTPAEMALGTGTIANNYRQGVSSLTNLAGGGANPGVVLSGLTNIGLQRNMATGRLLAQDAARRDMNFARFGSVTGMTAGMESRIENEKINRQLSDRQTGLGLAAGALGGRLRRRRAAHRAARVCSCPLGPASPVSVHRERPRAGCTGSVPMPALVPGPVASFPSSPPNCFVCFLFLF